MRVRRFIFDQDYYHTPYDERWFSIPSNRKSFRSGREPFLKALADGKLTYERVDCLCGGDEFDVLTSTDRDKRPQFVCICVRCGLVMNNPRLDARAYAYFYESGIYREAYGNVEELYDPIQRKGQYAEIVGYLEKNDPGFLDRKSVFEVGCNTGYHLYNFKQKGWRVGGVEPYEKACEIGNRHGLNISPGLIDRFQTGDKYDLVILIEAFEHIYDVRAALRSIRGLLTPRGIVFIKHIGILNESLNDIYKFAQVAHPYNHCLGTLRMIVEANGFEYVAGDEGIHAIFRRSERESGPMIPDPSNYAAIVGKFTRIEAQARSIKARFDHWRLLCHYKYGEQPWFRLLKRVKGALRKA